MATLPVRTHSHNDMAPNPNGNHAFPKAQRASIKREMKQMRKSGMKLRDIASTFGVAPATVLRYLK
jgi:hypothetical protein